MRGEETLPTYLYCSTTKPRSPNERGYPRGEWDEPCQETAEKAKQICRTILTASRCQHARDQRRLRNRLANDLPVRVRSGHIARTMAGPKPNFPSGRSVNTKFLLPVTGKGPISEYCSPLQDSLPTSSNVTNDIMTKLSQWRILALSFALSANWTTNCRGSGTFTNTGTLNVGRAAHTATLLPNGNVLVAGGANTNDANYSSAEIYSPESRIWTNTASLNDGRFEHTATLLTNGKVLIVGGRNADGSLASAEIYDPASGTWNAISSPSQLRHGHTATLLTSGRVLISGGYNSTNALSGTEVYDPDSQTWRVTGSMIYARGHHAAALLPTGKVIVAGGDNTNVLSSVELYDPQLGSWSLTSPLTQQRDGSTATLLFDGNILFAGGGSSSGVHISSAELFKTGYETWEGLPPMSEARWSATATRLGNGKVLLAGGYNESNAVAGAELYDPITRTWAFAASMEEARWGATATLLQDGEVLIAGGSGPNSYLRSAELFKLEATFCSPHKATATLQVVNGFIVGASITDTGCGYTNSPVVLIQGGGGTGATAATVISDGVVVAINITDAGCCYTGSQAPIIAIASPPFEPTVSISVSKVKVLQKVVLGRNYVLEASFDMNTWITTGPPFTAESESVVNEFEVIETGRYFQIHEVP